MGAAVDNVACSVALNVEDYLNARSADPESEFAAGMGEILVRLRRWSWAEISLKLWSNPELDWTEASARPSDNPEVTLRELLKRAEPRLADTECTIRLDEDTGTILLVIQGTIRATKNEFYAEYRVLGGQARSLLDSIQ